MFKHGDKINVDKHTNIQIIWPDKTLLNENVLNNNSIVCKVNYKEKSILFTGDIEEIAEKEIVKKYGALLKSDILKIAHHGSKTSSSEELLNLVKPAISVIGVGKNNKFGHPNNNVLDRLKNLNSEIYRTDKNGEIILKLYKNQIFVNTTVKGKGD